MREFRIKVNNEKTYVVKANDYNQAVKTLHSKLRDFDDTKKNINVVREFITNNGGKFSKSKDADAILDFIYKKTGVKNADYGDVLYIVKNYTNVKVDDSIINDKPIKKWVLQSTINPMLYLDEDKVAVPGAYRGKQFITKSDAEKWYYSIMSEPLGSKNATFKVVEAVVANDSSINDLVSKYNGEDAIRTNGFVKIKEDGDWTSYKYNGSDFDDAVFKIHQYNPSLIAFVSNGNRTITVRNKYLNDNAIEDSNILSGYKFRIINNGTKWYYETTFPDGHTTLTGPYSSKQETEQYFHKHRPTEKLTDANRYNKGQKFQTSAGIHEIIGYDPVKADVNTNRIEYSYRIKTPNGTYTNMPDWQLEELVKLGRYKLIDSSIQDADPVKVEKIIRKEKSALGITYYLFQTKSSNGYTIYYQVTDKWYHGEPTYSGGGIISFSLESANRGLDSQLLSDKLIAKYGEKEGTKRYLRGENDSAVKDSNIKDAGEEIRYLEGMKFNGIPYTGWAVQHWTDGYYTFDGKKPYIPSGGRDALLSIFKQGGFIGQWKGIKPDKGFESYFKHSTAVPAVKDSNNIKNRKSYTIKVGDKQYKVFAESESEAIDKYIKSKK